MRIGIDIRLKNESGVGRYVRNLIQELKKIDKDNEYILINPQIRWHSVKEQLFMPFILYGKKLDLAHFPYFNAPIFYFRRFIVTIHDLTIGSFNTGKASTLNPLLHRIKLIAYKFILWNAINRAEKIIVPTICIKRQIVRTYNIKSDKVKVIYEGVDRKLKSESSRPENDQPLAEKLKINPKHYFLYVGNAYPHKNLENLLEAFLKLKSQKPKGKTATENLKFVMAGRQDYFYNRLKRKAKEMELDKNVIFTGYVKDKELSWLYQNAIALVLPSLSEGFGLPALEAMENNCLVLCSDIPALREICRDSAVYFNPKNVSNISNVMFKAIENGKRRKGKVKKGKNRAKRFSWEKAARKTLKLYESSVSLR